MGEAEEDASWERGWEQFVRAFESFLGNFLRYSSWQSAPSLPHRPTKIGLETLEAVREFRGESSILWIVEAILPGRTEGEPRCSARRVGTAAMQRGGKVRRRIGTSSVARAFPRAPCSNSLRWRYEPACTYIGGRPISRVRPLPRPRLIAPPPTCRSRSDISCDSRPDLPRGDLAASPPTPRFDAAETA